MKHCRCDTIDIHRGSDYIFSLYLMFYLVYLYPTNLTTPCIQYLSYIQLDYLSHMRGDIINIAVLGNFIEVTTHNVKEGLRKYDRHEKKTRNSRGAHPTSNCSWQRLRCCIPVSCPCLPPGCLPWLISPHHSPSPLLPVSTL